MRTGPGMNRDAGTSTRVEAEPVVVITGIDTVDIMHRQGTVKKGSAADGGERRPAVDDVRKSTAGGPRWVVSSGQPFGWHGSTS